MKWGNTLKVLPTLQPILAKCFVSILPERFRELRFSDVYRGYRCSIKPRLVQSISLRFALKHLLHLDQKIGLTYGLFKLFLVVFNGYSNKKGEIPETAQAGVPQLVFTSLKSTMKTSE